MKPAIPLFLLATAVVCAGCTTPLPAEPPPLTDMEEPLELFAEPDDEALRRELPLGGFSGIHVADSRQTLDAVLGEAEGVEIAKIVENSPADIAGLRNGDLLLEARAGDQPLRALQYPSDWRAVELAAGAGTAVTVVFDRANRRSRTTLTTVERLRPPDRQAAERLREEDRIGVVLRTATEVEARGADLPPGAGAVIVGLSRRSPWRGAGLRYGDLITVIDDRQIAHPGVALEAIGAAGERMKVTYVRDGGPADVDAPLTERASSLRELYIPLVVDHESFRGKSDTSILLGIFRLQKTRAAWRFRLLWIIWFGGGDEDELLEVDQ